MITLITGVPGTGKTALVVSMLEKEIEQGRIVFTNITGLKLPHYKLGDMQSWQKGTWLHIDQYQRISSPYETEKDQEGSDNWKPNLDVIVNQETGELKRSIRNDLGEVVSTVAYESHKGALIVYDECQNTFRPRPNGSQVPDCVAAFEVHRKQGLDFWLITQRPMQIDSAVRGNVGRHIALRATSLGRWRYEWPEVGDIESKISRDTAARSRYVLPKRVFNLYKSAEVHTQNKHSLPLFAKALFLIVPLFFLLAFQSYKAVAAKTQLGVQPISQPGVQPGIQPISQPGVLPGKMNFNNDSQLIDIKEIPSHEPYERWQFSVVGYVQGEKYSQHFLAASENGRHIKTLSSKDLRRAGYEVIEISECAVKLIYKNNERFINCGAAEEVPQQAQLQAPLLQPLPAVQ